MKSGFAIRHHAEHGTPMGTLHVFTASTGEYTPRMALDATVHDLTKSEADGLSTLTEDKRMSLPRALFAFRTTNGMKAIEAKMFEPYPTGLQNEGETGGRGLGAAFAARVYEHLAERYGSDVVVLRDSRGVSPKMKRLLEKAGLPTNNKGPLMTLGQHAYAFRQLAERNIARHE